MRSKEMSSKEQGAGGKRVVRSREQPTHDKSGRCSRAFLRRFALQASKLESALRITHYALRIIPCPFNSFNFFNSFNSQKLK